MKLTLTRLITGVLLILQSVSSLCFPDTLTNMLYNFYIMSVVIFGDTIPRSIGLPLLSIVLLTTVVFFGSALAVFLKKKLFVRFSMFFNFVNILFSLGYFIVREEKAAWLCWDVLSRVLFSGLMIFLLLYYFKEHFGIDQLFKKSKANRA